MDIILNNYYELNSKTDINFYWLERNRKFIFKEEHFKKNINDAIYEIPNIVDGSYSLSFSNLNIHNYHLKYNDITLKNKSKKIFFKIHQNLLTEIESEEFIKNEYQLKLGVSKSARILWNLYWNCLHLLSFNYPGNPTQENMLQIKNLTNKMALNGLSCPKCLVHFRQWNKLNPIEDHYTSKSKLVKWYIDLHNDVNQRNKKNTLSLSQVENLYKKFNNDELISKYNLNVILLFKINQLDKLPDIINNTTKKILWKEYNIFQS